MAGTVIPEVNPQTHTPPPSAVEFLPDPARRWLARPTTSAFWPVSDAQARALDCPADILLLGGAAGSLKSSTMLIDLIQERDYPTMRSYFFRRTYKELEGGDGAIDQAHRLFPQTGGSYNSSSHTWRWPSGAEFYFRHAQHEKDIFPYQGHAMSALAIDESTHWPEKMVRYLITRNRSTDPDLKVRVRLGTNPGNVGHKWHEKLFLGGYCPHCEPALAAPQWAWDGSGLRWDGRWPSDGQPLEVEMENGEKVPISIASILSSVRDHHMYPASYQARLKMQSPATAKALLEGCWKIFEGQYFDVWEPQRALRPMVIPRRELGEQWWWPRWIASDFGFSISCSAAHLFLHMPQTSEYPRGRVVVADEFVCQETAQNFADAILKRWVLGDDGKPIEQRWMPWYLSPDAFREIGVGFTLAGQMNAVLEKHGLHFTRADNDRVGGWMKIYSALESGELIVCAECPKTIEAIESRIHDPDKENDVLKIPGDELDDVADACIAEGALVATERGDVPIESVRIGDNVLTRKGFKKVLWAGMTNADAPTLILHASNGSWLTGTANHPIFTQGNSVVRLDSLRYGDNLITCLDVVQFQKPSSSTESSFAGIRTLNNERIASTIGRAGLIERAGLARCIKKCGSLCTDLSRQVLSFITKTITLFTMRTRTLNWCLAVSMPDVTSASAMPCLTIDKRRLDTWPRSSLWPPLGIDPRKAESGRGRMPDAWSSASPCLSERFASNAQRSSKECRIPDSAPIGASRNGGATRESTTLRNLVSSAEPSSLPINTTRGNSALVHVVRLTLGKRSPVYNLTVEDEPEFFANGILVHNCRYGVKSWETARAVQVPRDVQVAEALGDLVKTDPTAAMHKYSQFVEKEKAQGAHSVYGGSARRRLEQAGKGGPGKHGPTN